MNYFGDRRTDLSVGNKFQGVETPSQVNIILDLFPIITLKKKRIIIFSKFRNNCMRKEHWSVFGHAI